MPQPTRTQTLHSSLAERFRRLAESAGIRVPKRGPSGDVRLPHNLSPQASLEERRLFAQASELFQDAFRKGQPLFHVTVCHPLGILPKKALCAEPVVELRKWAARRARRLTSVDGKLRVLGVVDVAWNDRKAANERSHWSVHLHLLVYWDPLDSLVAGNAKGLKKRIRKVFLTGRDTEELIGPNPTHVLRIRDAVHFERVLAYHAGSLALWDHTEARRHRRCRRSLSSNPNPEKAELPPKRQAEFTHLMSEIGPRAFRVLSGLRQVGAVIKPL